MEFKLQFGVCKACFCKRLKPTLCELTQSRQRGSQTLLSAASQYANLELGEPIDEALDVGAAVDRAMLRTQELDVELGCATAPSIPSVARAHPTLVKTTRELDVPVEVRDEQILLVVREERGPHVTGK